MIAAKQHRHLLLVRTPWEEVLIHLYESYEIWTKNYNYGIYDSKNTEIFGRETKKKWSHFEFFLLLWHLFLLTVHTLPYHHNSCTRLPDTEQHISLLNFKKNACININKMNQKILLEKIKRFFSFFLFLFKLNESSAKQFGICNQLFLHKHTDTLTQPENNRKQILLLYISVRYQNKKNRSIYSIILPFLEQKKNC